MDKQEMEFNEIVEKYSQMIYSIIHKLHIQQNEEEFYQEGLIALWYAWTRYEESKANFSTYAYWTVRGMLLNLIKEDRRFHETHCAWTPEMEEVIPCKNDSVSSVHERIQEIECYVLTFSEKQRIWLKEYVVNGKKLEEIAEKYGTTVAAVKSWRRSAIQNIRQNVSNDELYEILVE